MFGFQCKKSNSNNDNGLPPATETGQGVFACRINGEPWISKRGRPDMAIYYSHDTLTIRGTTSENSIYESFILSLVGTYNITKQVYEFNDTSKAFVLYLKYGIDPCFTRGPYGNVERRLTGGALSITKVDTLQKFFSGTFRFDVPTDFCDILKITDGRFDIKYQ